MAQGNGKNKLPCRQNHITMVTIGGDLQPGCLADRLLTGLGQPQINHKLEKKVYCSAEKGNHEQVGC